MARLTALDRREEILRAAVAQIAERGVAAVRVADVAAALGVSTALVFYHFRSKDRLVAEAFAYAARRDLDRLAEVAGSGGSARRRLVRALRLYHPSGSAAPGWRLWIDGWSAALREPELRRVCRRLDLRWRDTIAGIIAEGVAAGEFSCADPEAAAWRITALIDGLSVQTTVHRGVLTRRQAEAWAYDQAARELGLESL
ncbi:TetR family transcriptional regulator C-terminal domain-containing protein [Actinoallomurus sp. NPDC050550]|uniref:TetR family transcriptional regulator C-terminal domain-containing protein n=1 Tax=Actinoallomurus sp. NPDC050550 TaxID=3154937 RepID=UPI0033E30515